jgi:hypothetical protein
VAAVNSDGSFGRWGYAIVRDPTETAAVLEHMRVHRDAQCLDVRWKPGDLVPH